MLTWSSLSTSCLSPKPMGRQEGKSCCGSPVLQSSPQGFQVTQQIFPGGRCPQLWHVRGKLPIQTRARPQRSTTKIPAKSFPQNFQHKTTVLIKEKIFLLKNMNIFITKMKASGVTLSNMSKCFLRKEKYIFLKRMKILKISKKS